MELHQRIFFSRCWLCTRKKIEPTSEMRSEKIRDGWMDVSSASTLIVELEMGETKVRGVEDT